MSELKMYDPKVYDLVRITNTTHKDLDGQLADVLGTYGSSTAIIKFRSIPQGYNPAIVIVNACLEKVEDGNDDRNENW